MKEMVTMDVDKDIANAVQIIQTLRECGVINMSNELSCMDNLWERLTDGDKRFVAGVIKGAVVVLASKEKEVDV